MFPASPTDNGAGRDGVAAQDLDSSRRLALVTVLVVATSCTPLQNMGVDNASRGETETGSFSAFEDALREIEDLRHLLKVAKAERASHDRELKRMKEASERREENLDVIRRQAAYWEAETRAAKDEVLQMEERSLELVQQLQDSVSELGEAKREVDALQAKLARPALLQSELRRENMALKQRWDSLEEYLRLLQLDRVNDPSAVTALTGVGRTPESMTTPTAGSDPTARRLVSAPLGTRRESEPSVVDTAMQQPLLLLVAAVVLLPVVLLVVAVFLGGVFLWLSRRRRQTNEAEALRRRVAELETAKTPTPGLESLTAQLLAQQQLLQARLPVETHGSRRREARKGSGSSPTDKSAGKPAGDSQEVAAAAPRERATKSKSAAPTVDSTIPEHSREVRRASLGSAAPDLAGKSTETLAGMETPKRPPVSLAGPAESLGTGQLSNTEEPEPGSDDRTDQLPELETMDEYSHTDALPKLSNTADLEQTGRLPALDDSADLSHTGVIHPVAYGSATAEPDADGDTEADTANADLEQTGRLPTLDDPANLSRTGVIATLVPEPTEEDGETGVEEEPDADAATADITETAERLATEEREGEARSRELTRDAQAVAEGAEGAAFDAGEELENELGEVEKAQKEEVEGGDARGNGDVEGTGDVAGIAGTAGTAGTGDVDDIDEAGDRTETETDEYEEEDSEEGTEEGTEEGGEEITDEDEEEVTVEDMEQDIEDYINGDDDDDDDDDDEEEEEEEEEEEDTKESNNVEEGGSASAAKDEAREKRALKRDLLSDVTSLVREEMNDLVT